MQALRVQAITNPTHAHYVLVSSNGNTSAMPHRHQHQHQPGRGSYSDDGHGGGGARRVAANRGSAHRCGWNSAQVAAGSPW